MAQKTTAQYYDEDMAKAKCRDANKIVWVCESCGDISLDEDKWHSHTTSYVDGSYSYDISRVPYRMVLTKERHAPIYDERIP